MTHTCTYVRNVYDVLYCHIWNGKREITEQSYRDMEGDRETASINTEKGNDITIQLFTHTLQPYSASCKILC